MTSFAAKTQESPSVFLACLHGFLGQPKNWESVFGKPSSGLDWVAPDFCGTEFFGKTLAERAQGVNQYTQKISQDRGGKQPVILGYSLGGRIALHAILENPDFWKGAVVVSTNPGFSEQDPAVHTLRAQRVKADEAWAARFLDEPLDKVLEDWNSQKVFSGSKKIENELTNRSVCADLLTRCSTGRQEDLRPKIRSLKVPLLWISGYYDEHYREIGEEMTKLNSRIRSVVLPGGHRVPWDSPEEFQAQIQKFLFEIIADEQERV